MIFRAHVSTGCAEDSIVKIEGGYVIRVKDRAERGRANLKVVKLLAKELGVSSKAIKIKNPLSRDKLIEVKRDEIH